MPTTTLNVTVSRIPYPPATSDPDNWYILVCDVGTCKGKMSWRPRESDQLVLTGEWTAYKGEREFSFSAARIEVPTVPRDMLHYCCIRTIGLGPVAEGLLWDLLGDNWQSATEGCIRQLKGKTFAEFQLQIEALHGKSEEARVVAALIGKGCTVNMANAAWAQWQGETLGVVNADCYRLADLPQYSFQDVDKRVRKEYGIGDDDPRRIRAAVVYALRKLTDSGDTVVTYESLYQQACGMLGGYAEEVNEAMAELFNEGTLKAFEKSEGVSLAEDWKAEQEIWRFVNETATTEKKQ